MARYTKKDKDGRYYIESVNGKLESDIHGHTYGKAIDRFAELENADVASNAEKLESLILAMNEKNDRLPIMLAKAKSETATEIFAEIEEYFGMYNVPIFLTRDNFAKLKKKYTEGE